MMNKWIAAGIVALTTTSAFAQQQTFKILGGDLQFRNVATVESTTDFETFTGRTSGVSGTIRFDAAKRMGGGTIKIDLATIDTGIPLRNDHMKSEGWLNTAKYPTATFETTAVKWVKGDEYRATGKFSLHGVTKTITVPVRVRYRAESEATNKAGFKGNVIQISTKFDIKLSDYGIKIAGPAEGKVSNNVTVSVSTYGMTK